MGHISTKDIFYKVGKKIDNLHVRAPWNIELYNLIKTLFSEDDAEIYVKLPYTFSDFERIRKITKCEELKLRNILEGLCNKGVLIDICIKEKYYYMPSPMVIGIFEFSMMRTGEDVRSKELAKAFHDYLGTGEFYHKNTAHGQDMSVARAIPHREAVDESIQTEILDYESAGEIINSTERFGIGICSCRHEKSHVGEKNCDHPLETCVVFGWPVDYFVRRKFAREASRSEVLELLDQSKEAGRVFCTDNVINNPTFLCQCCDCCCNLLLGISKHGCTNTVVTSGYLATIDKVTCTGCGLCVKACPINAIERIPAGSDPAEKKKIARVDESLCLGCGVCALQCKEDSLALRKKDKRIIYPESTFERVILQCLGLGTLQNQIFDNPESMTMGVMRAILGAFLKLPTYSKTMMGLGLKSRFLRSAMVNVARAGMRIKGKEWLSEL